MRTQNQIETNYKSNRKPFNDKVGYVASRHNNWNGGWVVIYLAKEQGLDEMAGKYAVVCEMHSTILQTTSLPKARPLLKYPEFCEQCVATKKPMWELRIEHKQDEGFQQVAVFRTEAEARRAEKNWKTFKPFATEVCLEQI